MKMMEGKNEGKGENVMAKLAEYRGRYVFQASKELLKQGKMKALSEDMTFRSAIEKLLTKWIEGKVEIEKDGK